MSATVPTSSNFVKMNSRRPAQAPSAPVPSAPSAHALIAPSADVAPTPPTFLSQENSYKAHNYRNIYAFPPAPTTPIVFGVVSLGGGMFGDLTLVGTNTYRITNNDSSDVHKYWSTVCGMAAGSMPTVYIVLLDGSTNDKEDEQSSPNSSFENTMDVTMIGACYPRSNVTIVVYISNQMIADDAMRSAFTAAINGTQINGALVKPNVISLSWGFKELGHEAYCRSIDALLATATVPICVASGDYGAQNDPDGVVIGCLYPASSPNVVSCGGTTLYAPKLNYTAPVSEVAWIEGGGGYSNIFAKPGFQKGNSLTKRSVPDIAMNADPCTPCMIRYGGEYYYGGGTSIVAPMVAALIGCLGWKGTSRFINSRFYSKPTGFRPVDAGSNLGYVAKPGLDCCTGLGSPIGTVLKQAFPTTAVQSAVRPARRGPWRFMPR